MSTLDTILPCIVLLLMMMVFVGVFGSVYYDGEISGVSDVQSRISMIFVTTIFNGIINMSSVLPGIVCCMGVDTMTGSVRP